MKNPVLKSLVLLVVLALCAGAASAGCGTKDTHEGTLKSVDAENNTVVVVIGEEEVSLQLTSETQVTDADGNAIAVAELVGANVKVVSEHTEIESISAAA